MQHQELNNCKHIRLQRTWRSSWTMLTEVKTQSGNELPEFTRRKTKSLFMPLYSHHQRTVSQHHWALRPIGEAILSKNIPFLAAKLTSSLQLTRRVFIKLAQRHINSYSKWQHVTQRCQHTGNTAHMVDPTVASNPCAMLYSNHQCLGVTNPINSCHKKSQQKLCISLSLMNEWHFKKLHIKLFKFPQTEFLQLTPVIHLHRNHTT